MNNASSRILLPMLIIAITAGFSVHFLPSIPESYPMHFNAQGVPDGWSCSRYAPFVPVLAQIFITVILSAVFYIMGTPERYALLSKYKSSWSKYSPEEHEQMRQMGLRLMSWIMNIILLLFLDINIESWWVALGRTKKISMNLWFFIAGLFLVVIYFSFRTFKIALKKKT